MFQIRVITDYVNSVDPLNGLLSAFKKWLPKSAEDLQFDLKSVFKDAQRPRPVVQLQKNLSDALSVLLSGDERAIDKLFTEIDRITPRRLHTFWRASKVEAAYERGKAPFGLSPEVTSVRLGGKKWLAVSSYPLDSSLRQLLYGLLREAIFSNEVQRLGKCERDGCGKFTFSVRRKRRFCSDDCRYYHNNHKPERKKNYVKGVWKPK